MIDKSRINQDVRVHDFYSTLNAEVEGIGEEIRSDR
jgi:hypothetical protein